MTGVRAEKELQKLTDPVRRRHRGGIQSHKERELMEDLVADDKRDGDDLFEDLDKFSHPSRTSTGTSRVLGAKEVPSEEHVSVHPTEPQETQAPEQAAEELAPSPWPSRPSLWSRPSPKTTRAGRTSVLEHHRRPEEGAAPVHETCRACNPRPPSPRPRSRRRPRQPRHPTAPAGRRGRRLGGARDHRGRGRGGQARRGLRRRAGPRSEWGRGSPSRHRGADRPADCQGR